MHNELLVCARHFARAAVINSKMKFWAFRSHRGCYQGVRRPNFLTLCGWVGASGISQAVAR